jgi:hypothetical protein
MSCSASRANPDVRVPTKLSRKLTHHIDVVVAIVSQIAGIRRSTADLQHVVQDFVGAQHAAPHLGNLDPSGSVLRT